MANDRNTIVRRITVTTPVVSNPPNPTTTRFSDIIDVNADSPAHQNILQFDSDLGTWELAVNSATVNALDAVGDVSVASPTHGQRLVYNSATSRWEADSDVDTLSGLTDTSISSPSDAQVLTYDSDLGLWTAQNPTGGSGAFDSSAINTLAKLNAIVADAALVDSTDSRLSDSRTPLSHGYEAHDKNYLDSSTVLGFNFVDSATLAAFNYVDSSDSRLSDSRTPTTHGYEVHDKNYLDSDMLSAFNYVDSSDSRLSDARTPLPHIHVIASIDSAGDVNTSGKTVNQVLKWNGTSWGADSVASGAVNNLNDILDVNVGAATDGQYLKWDQDTTTWIADSVTAGTSIDSVGAIADVSISARANGQALVWNGTAWVNDSAEVKTHGYEAHDKNYLDSSTVLGFNFVDSSDSRLSDSRTPLSHGYEAHDKNYLDSSTVLGFNFVDSSDSRLSDSRTPLSHGYEAHDKNYLDSSTVLGFNFVDSADSRLSDARTPLYHEHTITDLDSVGNVNTSGKAAGQVLKWDGTVWGADSVASGAVNNLSDILDVNVAGVSNGQYLVWNDSANEWQADSVAAGGGGGSVDSVGAIGDVTVTAKANGQTLVWNGTAWVNDSAGVKSHGYEAHDKNYLDSSTVLGFNFVDSSDSRLSDSRTPLSHGYEAHDKNYIDSAMLAAFNFLDSSTILAFNYVDSSDSRLSDARTPLSHGNEVHSETYVDSTDSRLSDARTPLSHGYEAHDKNYLDSSTVLGFNFVDSSDSRLSDSRTPLSHGNEVHDKNFLDSANLDTLAKLNAMGTATLIDSSDSRLSDSRTPLSHGNEVHDKNFLDSANLDTLSKLNAIGTATLIDSSDSRLSDSRTPLSHGYEAHDKNYLDSSTILGFNYVDSDDSRLAANDTSNFIKRGNEIINPYWYKDTDEPILVLATGQSLMYGAFGGWFYDSSPPANPRVFDWSRDSANGTYAWRVPDPWAPLLDYDSVNHTGYIKGGNGNYGWAFCDELQKRTGRDVYLVLTAYTGSSILKWDWAIDSTTGSRGFASREFTNQAKGAIAAGPANLPSKADYLLWSQGYADADSYPMYHAGRLHDFRRRMEDSDWWGLTDSNSRYVLFDLPQEMLKGARHTWTGLALFDATSDDKTILISQAGARTVDGVHIIGDDLDRNGRRGARASIGIETPISGKSGAWYIERPTGTFENIPFELDSAGTPGTFKFSFDTDETSSISKMRFSSISGWTGAPTSEWFAGIYIEGLEPKTTFMYVEDSADTTKNARFVIDKRPKLNDQYNNNYWIMDVSLDSSSPSWDPVSSMGNTHRMTYQKLLGVFSGYGVERFILPTLTSPTGYQGTIYGDHNVNIGGNLEVDGNIQANILSGVHPQQSSNPTLAEINWPVSEGSLLVADSDGIISNSGIASFRYQKTISGHFKALFPGPAINSIVGYFLPTENDIWSGKVTYRGVRVDSAGNKTTAPEQYFGENRFSVFLDSNAVVKWFWQDSTAYTDTSIGGIKVGFRDAVLNASTPTNFFGQGIPIVADNFQDTNSDETWEWTVDMTAATGNYNKDMKNF